MNIFKVLSCFEELKPHSSQSRMRRRRRIQAEQLECRCLLAATNPLVLSSLDGTNGFRLDGIDSLDRAGTVSDAGDVNGDGFDDLFIGAPTARPGGKIFAGQSYVVFGKPGGFTSDVDLSTLNGGNGFQIDGIDVDDVFGSSLSGAGDVNGDGIDDLIIGARTSGAAIQTRPGKSYVVFGRSAGFTARVDLLGLNGQNGFRIDGINLGDRAGFSVSNAGDVNRDGLDDVIIGAINAAPGDAGESYVLFGQPSGFTPVVSLSSLDGTNGFRLEGINASDLAGYSVSSAGDVNGDGFDDVVIGAPNANTDNASHVGETYVVFGKSGGFASSMSAAMLDGTNGFRIDGIDHAGNSGFSVSSAGDVNGDGFDDLIIGTRHVHVSIKGESYVVFGKSGGFTPVLNLSLLDGTNGFRLEGIEGGDKSGRSVSSAGDINGDGFGDLLIGAYSADRDGKADVGESYVVFGKSGAFASAVDLSLLDGTNGFRLDGSDASDFLGVSVSGAGDVNGDGFDDLIVGAPGRNSPGKSYVVFGGNFTGGVETQVGTNADEMLSATQGVSATDVLIAGQGNDTLISDGGSDVLGGGQGNDVLAMVDVDFSGTRRIVGGSGTDTLRLDGSGLTLDLTAIQDNRVVDVEEIDITGSGPNTLNLNVGEVLNLSSTSNTVVIRRDSDDIVDIGAGWESDGVEVIGNDRFEVFTQGAATAKVMLSPGFQLILPLYQYPLSAPNTLSSWWQEVLDGATAETPLTMVANPASGPIDITHPDYANWITGLTELRNNPHVRILGYVKTRIAPDSPIVRDPADILTDVGLYGSAYKHPTTGASLIDGIFLDEMSNNVSDVATYATVATGIRSTVGLAGNFITGNPGTSIPVEYLDQDTADLFIVREGTPNDLLTNAFPDYVTDSTYSTLAFGAMVHSATGNSTLAEMLRETKLRGLDYVFVTDDTGENPYDESPSYFETLLRDVHAPFIAATTFTLPEDSPNGTVVGTPVSGDPDAGQVLTYTITAGNVDDAFAMNPSTGELTVNDANALDPEINGVFELTVQVADDATPMLVDAVTITIVLTDSAFIIDNLDSGFSTTAGWQGNSRSGHAGSILYAGGTGGNPATRFATWTTDVTPGDYRVSATWAAINGRSQISNPTAIYQVRDGATDLGTVSVNQRNSPDDRVDSGTLFEDLGVFTISGTTLSVTLSNAGAGFTIADAIRFERIVAPGVTIRQSGDATLVTEGGQTDTYEVVLESVPTSDVTITVSPDGQLDIGAGTGVSVDLTFTPQNAFVAQTIVVGAVDDSIFEGSHTGTITHSVVSGDANYNALSVGSISAEITDNDSSSAFIIDNLDSGFSTTAGWQGNSRSGHAGSILYAGGTGGNPATRFATWTTDVTPGDYRVSATWAAINGRSQISNPTAIYQVRDGATDLGTVSVNQRNSPDDRVDSGTLFEDLGVFTISGTTLSVTLSNAGAGFTIADAIRFERI